MKTKRIVVEKFKTISLFLVISLLSFNVTAESYTLNFKDAEIKELIKFVADATGYTFIVDPKVKGKIQVISHDPVDEQELYDLFLSVLQINGYAAVKNGNIVRVIPDKSARTSPVPVETGLRRPNSEFITQIISLENVSATKLIPVLRPLVPQEGHMAAYADTNAIIISDTADNIKKIIDIIKNIDKSSHHEIEVFRLEYASAEDTVRILEQLEKSSDSSGGKNATDEDRIVMVADKRSNSIIISGTQQSRLRLKNLVLQLDTPLESVGNAQVIYLHYASAKDLAPVLAKVSQNIAKFGDDAQAAAKLKGGQTPASIEADEATNSLIITAQADVMEGLKVIIGRLDIPRAQVLVEAIIVEVIQDNGKALGFDWLAANEHGGFAGSNQSGGLAGSVAIGAFDDDKEDALKGVAAAVAGVPGAIWGGADFNLKGTSFAAILTALETNGETNILSTPSLMTLDNNEATIVVGQEVPFVTGSYTSTGTGSSNVGNPFQTINRENVGITLTVTPHVNKGDHITLKILQEVSGLSGSTSELSTADVVTNQRRIETTVITGSGETIILGGLIQDNVQENISKVPVLGDLPVIGRLFQTSSTTVVKTNLMVFLRPTVIRTSDKLLEVSKSRYQDIRKVQRYKHARGVDLFDEEVLPLLPEWEKQLEQIERIQAGEADASRYSAPVVTPISAPTPTPAPVPVTQQPISPVPEPTEAMTTEE